MQPLPAQAVLIDQVYDRLVAAIADGSLPPGHRLTQEDVAARLGVSRQPVSHALQVLRRRGLLEEAGRRGLAVVPLDAQWLRDLYQVRAALEALAAALAAARVRVGAISPQEREEGQRLFDRGAAIAKRGAIRDLIEADVAFHSFLHRLSGNHAIIDTIAEQWPHFRRSMGVVLMDKAIARRVWAEHRAILDAILAGRAEEAAAAARRHIETAAEQTARRIESSSPK